MTNQSDKTSNQQGKFSVREFIDVFVEIDEQILQLHQCSSDDFLGLNADFKQYFSQSKVISGNASNIFKELTESESTYLIKGLETLYKDLKVIQNSFSKRLELSINQLNEIEALLDKLFLPVKNLNQDLLTLKFLLANLKISNSATIKSNIEENDKVVKQYNEAINNFKVCGYQNEVNLETLKDNIKRALATFDSIRGSNVNELDKILNNIHYAVILFAEKHEEVSRLIPELTSKTDNSSQSIAQIITNLQYHDIIRQKMEHVHATHKKLLSDLENSANSSKNQDDEGLEIQMARVRDIANLQSAQLVHANKEYQQAIEIITDKFVAIGNDMTSVSQMCHEINISQENTEEYHLQQIVEKLNNSASVLTLFLDAERNFQNRIDIISSQISKASTSVSKYSKALNDLEKATANTLNIYSNSINNDSELSKPLKQVEQINNDIHKSQGDIQQVFSSIEEKAHELLSNIIHTSKQGDKNGTIEQTTQSMNSLVGKLSQKSIRIKELLLQNLDMSKNISKDVRKSIGKVKYYDFFEKVIVDIISEFNQIYKMLKSEISQSDLKDDSIESIRRQYTMASEHQVHDKITQGEGEVDLFGDQTQNKGEDDDDDNLELF